MTGKLPDIRSKDFLSELGLLIKKVAPEQVSSTANFLQVINSCISEAEQKEAQNLIISAPYDSPLFERRLRSWIMQYLIPQMKHIGVKRVAFVMQKENCLPHQIVHQVYHFPEIGVFTTIPDALGWIMDLIKPTSNDKISCSTEQTGYCA